MGWSYCSRVSLNAKTVTLRQLWAIWGDVAMMSKYDPDVINARLETDKQPGVGDSLYITLKNDPTNEHKCELCMWKEPTEQDCIGLHFNLCLPLGKLTFKYDAVLASDCATIDVTIATVVSGFLSPLYTLVFRSSIQHGCEHMIKSVPELAACTTTMNNSNRPNAL